MPQCLVEHDYMSMELFLNGDAELEDDEYPPYWPPGTPPMKPSWVFPATEQVRIKEQSFFDYVKTNHPETNADFGTRQLDKNIGYMRKKIIEVALRRDSAGTLGFNLRYGEKPGGAPEKRPLVITRIKPGGPAFRSGCMRVGDQLTGINGVSLLGASLQKAQNLLLNKKDINAKLTLEIVVISQPTIRPNQLLVDLEKSGGDPSLGLSLASEKNAVIVARILPGSAAYRSSLLQVGDQILTVNGTVTTTPTEVLRLFSLSAEVIHLKISTAKRGSTKSFKCPNSPSMNYSPKGSSSTLSSGMSTLKSQKLCKTESNSTLYEGSVQSRNHRPNGVSHCESVAITLQTSTGGYGITLEGSWPPVIAEIEPGSPADLCGCLQPGDRILIINQTRCDCLAGAEAALLLAQSKPLLKLHVQFDVAEAVVPSSGVFMVNLARRGSADLGMFVTFMKIPANGPIISKIRQGSIAHRSGALQCGDQLLDICGIVPSCEEDISRALSTRQEIIPLTVLKVATISTNPVYPVDHNNVQTVELLPLGGRLGLTISGREMRCMPITISALTPGGLAESSGALYVGDQILSINGHNLNSYMLSEAIDLMKEAKDTITLQVSRSENSIPAPSKPLSTWQLSPRKCNFSSTDSELSTISLSQADDYSSECSASTRENNFKGNSFKTLYGATSASSVGSCLSDVHKVTLYKDGIYEDFGFSVSDGLYERGVYINRVRRGGPAWKSGMLQPLDRILQVNGTRTQDFDCCLTVPLIAAGGDKIDLVVARNPFAMGTNLDQRESADDTKEEWNESEIRYLQTPPLSNSM